jgi:hypothetical protein
MAKRAEKAETRDVVRFPTKEEYTKYRKRQRALRAEMDEAKGRMGNAKERAVAELNMHADADRVIGKYANKSAKQCAEFKLSLDMFWEYMELGQSEADLFTNDAKEAAPASGKAARKPGRPKGATAKAAQKAPGKAAPAGMTEGQRLGDPPTHIVRAGKVVPLNGGTAEAAE